jgi:hypothetical protein
VEVLLVEPSAVDIPPQDEQEGFEHGMDKTLQKELTRDASGDDTVVETNAQAPSGAVEFWLMQVPVVRWRRCRDGLVFSFLCPLSSPSSCSGMFSYFILFPFVPCPECSTIRRVIMILIQVHTTTISIISYDTNDTGTT